MTAVDREQRTKRRFRRDVENAERRAAATKRELENAKLGNVLGQMGSTFPALPALLSELRRVHDAAVPLPGVELGRGGRSAETTTPLESGASTRPARNHAKWVNSQIEGLTDRLEENWSPKGRLEDGETPFILRVQCWNPNCPAYAQLQGLERLVENGGSGLCISCQEDFTAFRRPDDKTKCWSSECAVKLGRSRGHLGACP